MNRQEFMDKLKSQLKSLDENDYNNAIEYYEEYFNEAGKENEQKVIEELGSPFIIANKLLANDTMKKIEDGKKTTYTGIKGSVLLTLSILSLPISLPLAIALASILFAFVISFIGIYVSFGVTGIGFTVSGLGSVILSIAVLFVDAPTGLELLGVGLTLLGIGLIIVIVTYRSGKFLFIKLALGINKLLKKIVKGVSKNEKNS